MVRSLRTFDWVLIVAFTTLWGGLSARALEDGFKRSRGVVAVGISSAPAPDAYPTMIWKGSSQLQKGDEVLSVDGMDLSGASALRFYDRATRVARERGSVTVRVRREGVTVEKHLQLKPAPGWWTPLPIHAGLFLTGLLLLVLAPGWHLARRHFIALAGIASAYLVCEKWHGPGATAVEAIAYTGLLAPSQVLFVWNAQEFTLSARPVPWPHRLLALSAAILPAHLYLVRYHLPYTAAVGDTLLLAGFSYFAALAIAGLSRAYTRSLALERRQVRWVILGSYVTLVGGAVGIFLGGAFTRALGFQPQPTAGRALAALLALGGPIGVLISVIGYGWLDVDRLISRAASYTVVGLAALGGAFALLPPVARSAAALADVDPAMAQWLLNMAVVAAAIPVHRFLWPRIDRGLFPERHRRAAGFEQLLDDLGRYASVEDLVRLAGERVDALLQPESIAVYRRDGRSFEPVFVRGREATPSIEADSLLARALERAHGALHVDSKQLEAFDRAALETLGVTLLVPIPGREGLGAFACLGSKRSGDIYTREEVAALEAVAKGSSEVVRRLTEAAEPLTGPQVFRREGDLWTIASFGKEIRLRDMRGLHYLATLLREPRREFHVSDLSADGRSRAIAARVEDPELRVARGLGDAGERLDARAHAAYRERLLELEDELSEAERHSDLGGIERARAEREALLEELTAAARGSRNGSHSERARVAVTKAIGAALDRIAASHPELGAHLSATIRRGYFCAYFPDPRAPADWEA